jgi:hypothetical protein
MRQNLENILWAAAFGVALTLSYEAVGQVQNPDAATPPTRAGAEHAAVDTRMQAPVGHRQPKPSDLPADAARKESAPDPSARELDDKLRICRGC